MNHIFTVCTGPNYFPWHVERLYNEIKNHTTFDFKFYVYTPYPKEEFGDHITVIPIMHDRGVRQWYKMDIFAFAPKKETCFILDLDWTFFDDVTDILEQEVQPKELIAPYRWWTSGRKGYNINGGLYKFIGGSLNIIPDVFYQNDDYWMNKYINMGLAKPPVNGEQNCVEEICRKNKVNIKFFEPRYSIGRWRENGPALYAYNILYYREFGFDNYLYGDLIDSRVRMLQSILPDYVQLSRI